MKKIKNDFFCTTDVLMSEQNKRNIYGTGNNLK